MSDHKIQAEQLLHSAEIAIGQYEENLSWTHKKDLADNLTAQAFAHAALALVDTIGFQLEQIDDALRNTVGGRSR